MKTWLKPLCLALMTIILGTGCNAKDASTTPPIESPTELPSAEQPAIQEKENFTFAVSGQFKPFNFEQQDGSLTGFDVELGEELARRLDMNPIVVKEPQASLLEGLQQQQYDAVISSLSITTKRAERFSFTKPYYVSGAQVFIKNDNDKITTLEDLTDKKIGAVDGTAYHTLAKNYSKKIANHADYKTMLQELVDGKTDAIIMDRMMGIITMKENKAPLKPVGEFLYKDEIGIAVAKDRADLLDLIESALDEMIKDGTYEQISMKWFGVDISR
ncbi:transporter substrate-binding domain-containing protein [Ammoniphilus sp. CFH 90114]|uniref:transporter substrate-binding domain-containing protein n=1 Tax=Ammoniphilus sp. CFH 90114 TaxID=2493665 RepID=UPI0013E93B57|nr:transporter substrate-binding domain-containing protein [Ammoniphilus sp. CFH 90114]